MDSNFDGYETYLYNVSSSYLSSSMGEFKDTSWPKTMAKNGIKKAPAAMAFVKT